MTEVSNRRTSLGQKLGLSYTPPGAPPKQKKSKESKSFFGKPKKEPQSRFVEMFGNDYHVDATAKAPPKTENLAPDETKTPSIRSIPNPQTPQTAAPSSPKIATSPVSPSNDDTPRKGFQLTDPGVVAIDSVDSTPKRKTSFIRRLSITRDGLQLKPEEDVPNNTPPKRQSSFIRRMSLKRSPSDLAKNLGAAPAAAPVGTSEAPAHAAPEGDPLERRVSRSSMSSDGSRNAADAYQKSSMLAALKTDDKEQAPAPLQRKESRRRSVALFTANVGEMDMRGLNRSSSKKDFGDSSLGRRLSLSRTRSNVQEQPTTIGFDDLTANTNLARVPSNDPKVARRRSIGVLGSMAGEMDMRLLKREEGEEGAPLTRRLSLSRSQSRPQEPVVIGFDQLSAEPQLSRKRSIKFEKPDDKSARRASFAPLGAMGGAGGFDMKGLDGVQRRASRDQPRTIGFDDIVGDRQIKVVPLERKDSRSERRASFAPLGAMASGFELGRLPNPTTQTQIPPDLTRTKSQEARAITFAEMSQEPQLQRKTSISDGLARRMSFQRRESGDEGLSLGRRMSNTLGFPVRTDSRAENREDDLSLGRRMSNALGFPRSESRTENRGDNESLSLGRRMSNSMGLSRSKSIENRNLGFDDLAGGADIKRSPSTKSGRRQSIGLLGASAGQFDMRGLNSGGASAGATTDTAEAPAEATLTRRRSFMERMSDPMDWKGRADRPRSGILINRSYSRQDDTPNAASIAQSEEDERFSTPPLGPAAVVADNQDVPEVNGDEPEPAEPDTQAADGAEATETAAAAPLLNGLPDKLEGYLTYQSLRLREWRRRYYRLEPDQLQLFHAKEDATPTSLIRFTPGSTVSAEYPDSQAEGSFRLSVGSETADQYFIFCDTKQEKNNLLEGLKRAIAQ